MNVFMLFSRFLDDFYQASKNKARCKSPGCINLEWRDGLCFYCRVFPVLESIDRKLSLLETNKLEVTNTVIQREVIKEAPAQVIEQVVTVPEKFIKSVTPDVIDDDVTFVPNIDTKNINKPEKLQTDSTKFSSNKLKKTANALRNL
jgi:hypothetical protein